MDAKELKKALFRMGVPIHKDGKISKKDVMSLSFEDSGLEVGHIENLGFNKAVDSCTFKLHATVSGGDCATITEVFEKNKPRIESNLMRYVENLKLGGVEKVECNMKACNDENIWLNIVLHFDFAKAFADESCLYPFCYQLLEKKYKK